MEIIIDKKVYDTETADLIAKKDSGLPRCDFYAWENTLYRTKKGQYFLYKWGGAATSLAQRQGNQSCEGWEIKLFSREEAYKWLEDNGFIKIIKDDFADLIKEG